MIGRVGDRSLASSAAIGPPLKRPVFVDVAVMIGILFPVSLQLPSILPSMMFAKTTTPSCHARCCRQSCCACG